MIEQREKRGGPSREILIGPLIRIGLLRAWALRDHFIRLAIVPLAIRLALAQPLVAQLIPLQSEAAADQADGTAILQAGAMGLLYSAAGAFFWVNWIRQLTLGYAGAPGVGLGIAPRHLRFFLMIAALTILVFFPVIMIGMPLFSVALQNPWVGMVAALVMASLLWLALLARLSPAWIGIAIDARMRPSVAWNRTRGQGFKLMLAVLSAEIVVIFTEQIVSMALHLTGFVAAAPYSSILISQVIDLAGTAVQLAILVTAFPHFLRETV